MALFRSLSSAEQVAAHLRAEIESGGRSGVMAGVLRLEGELGVNRKTVEVALRQLEKEGLLESQGVGRRRLIRSMVDVRRAPGMRVAILPSEKADRNVNYLVELLHELRDAGHDAFFTPASMTELGMDPNRIAGMVKGIQSDVWVVVAGSHEVMEWFSKQKKPTFALFGRRRGFAMASVGPDKATALAEATRALIALGHRRIVLLARPQRRLPNPGASEQAFLDELAAHGIVPDSYHLPDWEVTVSGFYGRLEALFRVTPPTALIVDETPFFVATQQFLAERGLRVPEDVSLVSTDADPAFDWCRKSVAHIHWDSGPVLRRVLRWVDRVSHGKEDLRQTLTPAEFVPGGTIGRVRGEEVLPQRR